MSNYKIGESFQKGEVAWYFLRIFLGFLSLFLLSSSGRSQGLHENANKLSVGTVVRGDAFGSFQHYGFIIAKASYGETFLKEFSSMLGIGRNDLQRKFGVGFQTISGYAKGWGAGVHLETQMSRADVWTTAGLYKTDRGGFAFENRMGLATKISSFIFNFEGSWRAYAKGEDAVYGWKMGTEYPLRYLALGMGTFSQSGILPRFRVSANAYF